MTDQERTPLIRLQVDQEVFIDTVQSGDVIEDATVATEVTSIERIGDAYVLEGAIVFSGYLKHATGTVPNLNTAANQYDLFSGEAEVEHVHHRMPFVLRVPAKSQPKGLVNVASRISSWSLDVKSAGWLRVLAELNVVGLYGQGGFHFQCGAQEEGDVFFDQFGHLTPTNVMEDSAAFEPVAAFRSVTDTTAEDAPQQEVSEEGFVSQFHGNPDDELGHSVIEAVSSMRGGNAEEPSAPKQSDSVREQLKEFDRAFSGLDAFGTEGTASRAHGQADLGDSDPNKDSIASQPVSASDDAYARADVPVEFEFVHQVPNPDVANPVPNANQSRESAFVPSRSFSSDGFHPAGAFAATDANANEVNAYRSQADDTGANVVSSVSNEIDDNTGLNDEADSGAGGPETRFAARGEGVTNQSELWSFVDFHQPERLHTLRYVVVMEEETIEAVSDRVGCMKSDLVRVNHLPDEHVRAGQTLLVPNRQLFLRAQ